MSGSGWANTPKNPANEIDCLGFVAQQLEETARYVDPADTNGHDGQDDQRDNHDRGRLVGPVRVLVMSAVLRDSASLVFTVERHEYRPEHVEGGHENGDDGQGEKHRVVG